MKKIYPLILIFSLVICSVGAQTGDTITERISTEATYTFDIGRVLSGGIEQHNFYMGLIDLSLTAELWKNGELYVQVQNTHGGTPTAKYVGDLHVFSNIENANRTYLYMAWYKHTFNKFSATIGVHDLNSEFVASDYASLFCNSSFGIQPSASWNMPVSIFPKNTLGLVLAYDISDKLKFQTSLYDGDPTDLDVDPYNLNFKIDPQNEGFISFSELHIVRQHTEFEATNTYKIGFQYHTADCINYKDSSIHNGNYGFYFIGDHAISNSIGAFVQLGITPKERNLNSLYAGGGLHLHNFEKRPDDVFGLAVAYGKLSPHFTEYSKSFETAIECTYSLQATENITIQPDVQYIINPGATNSNHAIVGFIRCSLNL